MAHEGSEDTTTSMRDADRANGEPDAMPSAGGRPGPRPGTDTPTGTDPAATYDGPGYEDKSFGQAVGQDQELVDDLLDETGGDADEAAARFHDRSAGRPAAERQAVGGEDPDSPGAAIDRDRTPPEPNEPA